MVQNDKHYALEIADYYSEKLSRHGVTPAGVDWNGHESQVTRFDQLSKVLPLGASADFVIADIGCGYGAFYDYLIERQNQFSYVGIDISPGMQEAARKRLSENSNVRIPSVPVLAETVDYSIASGLFNVRLKTSDKVWLEYCISILDRLNTYSAKGFAFNCLTTYSDADKMRDYLYYADPADMFNHCKTHYSNNVALLHDYELYEFTILVRKS